MFSGEDTAAPHHKPMRVRLFKMRNLRAGSPALTGEPAIHRFFYRLEFLFGMEVNPTASIP